MENAAENITAVSSKQTRHKIGKAQKKLFPIASLNDLNTHCRPNPIDILRENSTGRMHSLLPLRYERMSASPFSFYRGSAAVMASDLSLSPSTNIKLQVCGDCHLLNFGGFATPERKLVFDINDFDETSTAPWEWDVKRLAASFAIAGRDKGFTDLQCREAAWTAANSYRKHMAAYAEMSALQIWYAQIGIQDLIQSGRIKEMKQFDPKEIKKAIKRVPHQREFAKLTHNKLGHPVIKDNPPLIFHVPKEREADFFAETENSYHRYLRSLSHDKKTLLSRYKIQDVAMKVVGVGSVGTFCGVLLLMSATGDPLFLQFKEAHQSVLEPYAGKSKFKYHGQRVVAGQKLIQSATDIFLGWTTDAAGRQFYIRQLRDAKVKPSLETMDADIFLRYAKSCGWALSRAHARTGDAAILNGYMGQEELFEDTIAKYAMQYADQNEKDYGILLHALKHGLLPT
ncbi:MAG: DUF2252 domain-containing protein [Bacteroidia bacterium]